MNGLRWNLEIFRYNTEVSIAICCIFDKIFRVWINIKGLYSPVKYRGIWMVKYGGSAMKYVRSSIKYGGSDMKYGWSPMKFGNIGISITIWFDVSSINYLGSLMKYEGSPLSSKILRVYGRWITEGLRCNMEGLRSYIESLRCNTEVPDVKWGSPMKYWRSSIN